MFYFYAWGLNWCIVINIGLTVNRHFEEYTGLFHAQTSSLYYQEDNLLIFCPLVLVLHVVLIFSVWFMFVCFVWWFLTPLSTIFQPYHSRVLLVEETGGPGENHRPVTSHWQTLLHNVVHLVLIEIQTYNISGDRHWLIGICKSNYHTITAMTGPPVWLMFSTLMKHYIILLHLFL